ncbi:MAG: lipid-A-disaccharide synthase N-terminal domain-containing protein [Bacteroidales bacterium]
MIFSYITIIGFLAQILFSARILVQWIMSEKAKKIVSPSIYWVLSLLASYLMFVYGWLRDDFSIILGQFISYYIYIWNLNKKGLLDKIPKIFTYILIATPIVVMLFLVKDAGTFVDQFFHDEDIPLYLITIGVIGQLTFTLRFVYQWVYSFRRHISVLPIGFWIISIIGSGIIIAYAIMRLDIVLIVGQSCGFIAYGRNVILGHKEKKLIKEKI